MICGKGVQIVVVRLGDRWWGGKMQSSASNELDLSGRCSIHSYVCVLSPTLVILYTALVNFIFLRCEWLHILLFRNYGGKKFPFKYFFNFFGFFLPHFAFCIKVSSQSFPLERSEQKFIFHCSP